MTIAKTCALTILMAVPLAAQAPPQPRPPQTFTVYLQGQYANIKNNLVRSAEKMLMFRHSPRWKRQ